MKYIILLAIVCSVAFTYEDEIDEMDEFEDILPMELHFIDHQDAKCLDGSPSAYYFHQGTSDDLLIYFYTGGFCIKDSTHFNQYGEHAYIDSCDTRINTFFGSTKEFPQLYKSPQGIFGTTKYSNKYLKHATKVWLMYCDGSLWFNQMNTDIFTSFIKQINQNPSRIIIAGAGAGALYLTSEINSLVPIINELIPNVPIKLLLDSVLLQLSNQPEVIAAFDEVAARVNKDINQLIGTHVLEKISIPTFIVQSQYDWWQLEVIHGITCHHLKFTLENCIRSEKKQIEKIREKEKGGLLKLLKTKPNWGLWYIACFWNDFIIWTETWQATNHMIPANSGLQLNDAFQQWLDETPGNHVHYDLLGWPNNGPCSMQPKVETGDPQFDQMKENLERKAREEAQQDDL